MAGKFTPNNTDLPKSNAPKKAIQVVEFPQPLKSYFMRFLQQATGEDTIASSVNVDTIAEKTPLMTQVGSTTNYAQGVNIINSSGQVISDFGAPSTQSHYTSPADFTAARASNTTLSLTNLPPVLSTLSGNDAQVVYVKVVPASGDAKVYINGSGGTTLEMTTGDTITAKNSTIGAGFAPFVAGDSYEVGINYKGTASLLSTIGEAVPATHWSPSDGTVVWASDTTLTASGFPFDVDDTACFIKAIAYRKSSGQIIQLYNGKNGIKISATSNTITVTGAGSPFAATDTYYRVAISYQDKGYDITTDTDKVTVQNCISTIVALDSLVDMVTTITTGATYYPSSTGMTMDGYRNLSLTGKFVTTSTTTTMTVEATNDEDTSTADWVQIYGYDVKNNSTVNSIAAASTTTTFALDFDNLNFSSFRILIDNGVNTSGTNIVKARRTF